MRVSGTINVHIFKSGMIKEMSSLVKDHEAFTHRNKLSGGKLGQEKEKKKNLPRD